VSIASRVSSWATRLLPVKVVRSHLSGGLASLTFDDFPRSAWATAGRILESFKARATYYVAGGLCGRRQDGLEYFTEDDLLAVHAAGHEVGGHTFSHFHVPALSSKSLVDDADRNAEFVRRILGDVWLCSFAYPYGDVSPRTKLLFSRIFPSCRGIESGFNARIIDLAQLRCVALYSRLWQPSQLERLAKETAAAKGWIILRTHDVSERPTAYGCTPAVLEHALGILQETGIVISPVKHAVASLTFTESSQVGSEADSQKPRSLGGAVRVTEGLGPDLPD
jgi:peptidoglycan/xylan/chitin deacetylase (PgdA/CDA1 family)